MADRFKSGASDLRPAEGPFGSAQDRLCYPIHRRSSDRHSATFGAKRPKSPGLFGERFEMSKKRSASAGRPLKAERL